MDTEQSLPASALGTSAGFLADGVPLSLPAERPYDSDALPGVSMAPSPLDYGIAQNIKDDFLSGREDGLAALAIDQLSIIALGSGEEPIPLSEWGKHPATVEAQELGLVYSGLTPSQQSYANAGARERAARAARSEKRSTAGDVLGFAGNVLGNATDPADIATSFVGGALVSGIRKARIMSRGSKVARKFLAREAVKEAALLHARDSAFVKEALGRIGKGALGGFIDNATWRPAVVASMYDERGTPYTTEQWMNDAVFGAAFGGALHSGSYVAGNGVTRMVHRLAVTRAIDGIGSAGSLEAMADELQRFSPEFAATVNKHTALRDSVDGPKPDLELARKVFGDIVRDYGRSYREAVGGHNEARIQEIRTKVYGHIDGLMGDLVATLDEAKERGAAEFAPFASSDYETGIGPSFVDQRAYDHPVGPYVPRNSERIMERAFAMKKRGVSSESIRKYLSKHGLEMRGPDIGVHNPAVYSDIGSPSTLSDGYENFSGEVPGDGFNTAPWPEQKTEAKERGITPDTGHASPGPYRDANAFPSDRLSSEESARVLYRDTPDADLLAAFDRKLDDLTAVRDAGDGVPKMTREQFAELSREDRIKQLAHLEYEAWGREVSEVADSASPRLSGLERALARVQEAGVTFVRAFNETVGFKHISKARGAWKKADFDFHMAHSVPADKGSLLGRALGVELRKLDRMSPNKGITFLDSGDHGRTLFLREDLFDKPHAFVSTVMHEWAHSLSRLDPDAYGRLVGALHAMHIVSDDGKQTSAFVHGLDRIAKAYGEEWRTLDPERQLLETVAESLAITSEQSPAFWRDLRENGGARFASLIPLMSRLEGTARKLDSGLLSSAHGKAVAKAMREILDKSGLGEPLREVAVASLAEARRNAHRVLTDYMDMHRDLFPHHEFGSKFVNDMRKRAARADSAWGEAVALNQADGPSRGDGDAGEGPNIDTDRQDKILTSTVPVEKGEKTFHDPDFNDTHPFEARGSVPPLAINSGAVPPSPFTRGINGMIPYGKKAPAALASVEAECGLVPLGVIRDLIERRSKLEGAGRGESMESQRLWKLIEHHRNRWTRSLAVVDAGGNSRGVYWNSGRRPSLAADRDGHLIMAPTATAGCKVTSADHATSLYEFANRNGVVLICHDAAGLPVDRPVEGGVVEFRKFTEPAAPRLSNSVDDIGDDVDMADPDHPYEGTEHEPDDAETKLGVFMAGRFLRQTEELDFDRYFAGLPESVRKAARDELDELGPLSSQEAANEAGLLLEQAATRYDAGIAKLSAEDLEGSVKKAAGKFSKSTRKLVEAADDPYKFLYGDDYDPASVKLIEDDTDAARLTIIGQDAAGDRSFQGTDGSIEDISADLYTWARLKGTFDSAESLVALVRRKLSVDGTDDFLRRMHAAMSDRIDALRDEPGRAKALLDRDFRRTMRRMDNLHVFDAAVRLNPDGTLHPLSMLPVELRRQIRAAGIEHGGSPGAALANLGKGKRSGAGIGEFAHTASFDEALAVTDGLADYIDSDARSMDEKVVDAVDRVKHGFGGEAARTAWSRALATAREANPEASVTDLLSSTVDTFVKLENAAALSERFDPRFFSEATNTPFSDLVVRGRTLSGDASMSPFLAAARAIDAMRSSDGPGLAFPDMHDTGMASPAPGDAGVFGFFKEAAEKTGSALSRFGKGVMGQDLTGAKVELHPVKGMDNATMKESVRTTLLSRAAKSAGLPPAKDFREMFRALLDMDKEAHRKAVEAAKAAGDAPPKFTSGSAARKAGLSGFFSHMEDVNRIRFHLLDPANNKLFGRAAELLETAREDATRSVRFKAYQAKEPGWKAVNPTEADIHAALDAVGHRALVDDVSRARTAKLMSRVGTSADKLMNFVCGRYIDGSNVGRALNLDNLIHTFRDEVTAPLYTGMSADGVGEAFLHDSRVARATSMLIRGDLKAADNLPGPAAHAARTMAKLIDNAREHVRERVGASGRFIPRSEAFAGFDGRHDGPRILRDAAGWRSFMNERLDFERIEALHGGYFDDGAKFTPEGFLDSLFAEVRRMEAMLDDSVRDTSSLNRKQFHKMVSWKNASDAFDYDVAYGSGHPEAAMIHDIRKVARECVIWEQLGSEPRATLTSAIDSLPVGRAVDEINRAKVTSAVAQVMGDLSSTVNPVMSQGFHTARNAMDLAFMPGAAVTVLGDMANLAGSLRYLGARVGSIDMAVWKGMWDEYRNHKDPATAQFYLAQGIGSDIVSNAVNEVMAVEGLHSTVEHARNTMLNLNLFGLMTKLQDRAFINIATVDLAEKAMSGDLSAHEVRALGQAGITHADLPELSKAITELPGRPGKRVDVRLIRNRVLRDKVQAYLRDFRTQGQLQADAGTLGMLACGTKQGTLARGVLSLTTQYMAIPVATLHKVWGRFRHGYGDQGFLRSITDPKTGAAVHLAAWAGSSMVMGYIAYNFARMLKGEAPTTFDDEVENKDAMMASLAGGGCLGLGKALLTGYIGGPAPHVLYDVGSGVQQTMFGDNAQDVRRAQRRGLKAVGSLTPLFGGVAGPELSDAVMGETPRSKGALSSTARTAGMLTMGHPMASMALFGLAEALKAGVEARAPGGR